MNALRVAGMTVSAAGRALLVDVSLSVAPGEMLAIVGPSGLGKSQLLRALATLDDAPGHLTLDHKSPSVWGFPAWRRAVVLVQQRGVMLDGSVRANLLAPFELAVSKRPPSEADLVARLASLGIQSTVLEQSARRLSMGQAQRISLARALLIQPRVLLLDEPTAGLDPAATSQVEALLRAACDEGVGVILVSHDPDQPSRLGASVLHLARFAVESVHVS